MDRYGYQGDVSYHGQNRFKAYYNGLGSVRPVESGSGYVGAPGKVIMRGLSGRGMSARERDGALFASLGIEMSGPRYGVPRAAYAMRPQAGFGPSSMPAMGVRGLGTISDRDLCNTLAAAGASLVSGIGGSVLGPRPTRRAGESDDQFNARTTDWENASRALTTAAAAGTTAQTLCNLIDPPPGTPPPSSSNTGGLSAWEIEALRRQFQTQMDVGTSKTGTGTKVAIGAGAVALVGLAVFALL